MRKLLVSSNLKDTNCDIIVVVVCCCFTNGLNNIAIVHIFGCYLRKNCLSSFDIMVVSGNGMHRISITGWVNNLLWTMVCGCPFLQSEFE